MQLSQLWTLALAATTSAHNVITYPGWRGDNLRTNETFPYGMQWMYPCGGVPTTTNRTYWPTTGGAVAFQPGWFAGHSRAVFHINLGFGTDGPDGGPPNMSNRMFGPLQIIGPSDNPYPGTVCIPQVPLPVNASVQPGDKATIQLVELAQHGAALFSCVDIIFEEPGSPKVALVNESNCFNSTDLGFAELFSETIKQSGSNLYEVSGTTSLYKQYNVAGWLPLLAAGLYLML